MPEPQRSVLMFGYWLPPCSAFPTPVVRVDGLAAWLQDFGWRPVVLAPEPGAACDCEGCRGSGPVPELRYVTVRVPVVARKGPGAWRVASAAATDLDPVSGWPTAAIAAAERVLKQERVDAIWATATPFSSLWAADRLARRFELPWVADIRDSLALKWGPIDYKNLPALARLRRILRRASAVVEAWPEHAVVDSEWLGRPCEWVTSGFEPNHWRDPEKRPEPEGGRQRLEVACAGMIYPGHRTLGPALAGVRRLYERSPSADVRISYFGRSDDLVRRDAARYGVDDVVECRGFLAPERLRAHLASADVLLLPTSHGRRSDGPRARLYEYLGAKRQLEIPGGKLYEYLGARRPVLAVPGEDPFVARVLPETGAGRTATSPNEVAGVLGSWLEELRESGAVAYRGDKAAVDRYSMRESARRLAALLDRTVGDRASGRSARAPGNGRPLRVLMIGAVNSPHTEHLALGARDRGFEVLVGGGIGANAPETTLPEHGIKVSVATRPMAPWLRGLVADFQPDLVHANWLSDAFRCLVYGAVPLAATAWGSDVYRVGRIGQLENRLVARCASMVIADSVDLLDRLHALGAAPERSMLFNWGVDLGTFSPPSAGRSEARRKLGLPDGKIILSPRSLRDVYNPRTIVDAFELIAERHPALHLLLKHMHTDHPDLGPLRFPERVHIIGHVPYERMADYYRAADVCVSIPSSDSSPRSVWEAMASDTPCVISDLPWAHELLRDGREALIVPVDAASVASALERLLDDAELVSRIASNGRAVVERHRNPEVEFDRLAAVYERLAKRRSGTSRPSRWLQTSAAAASVAVSRARHGDRLRVANVPPCSGPGNL